MVQLSDLDKQVISCEIDSQFVISQKTKFAIDDFMRNKLSVDDMIETTLSDEYPVAVYMEMLEIANTKDLKEETNKYTLYCQSEKLKDIKTAISEYVELTF